MTSMSFPPAKDRFTRRTRGGPGVLAVIRTEAVKAGDEYTETYEINAKESKVRIVLEIQISGERIAELGE